jgi:hypothetical protein
MMTDDQDSLDGDDRVVEHVKTPVAEYAPAMFGGGGSGGGGGQSSAEHIRTDEHGNYINVDGQPVHGDSLHHEQLHLVEYPCTLTTYQTSQRRPDGTVRVITRTVRTRVSDPTLTSVRFTGSDTMQLIDDHLRQMDEENEERAEFDSVDEMGNQTKTVITRLGRSQTHEPGEIIRPEGSAGFVFEGHLPTVPGDVMTTSVDSLEGRHQQQQHQIVPEHRASQDSLNH